MEEEHYCRDPERVRIIEGASNALRRLRDAGFCLVIITNQSGIGRGYFTTAEYDAVQERLHSLLGAGMIDATYFCPDAPDTPSSRRKPEPGMVIEAARDLRLDLARSWFVGDKAVDVECGHRAGTRAILVRTGHGHAENAPDADFVAKDFASAANFILRTSDARP